MKKGYTLIELVVYISLIVIISGIAMISIRSMKELNENISDVSVKDEIVEFIENCRRKCKMNECFGEVIIDKERNRLLYKENMGILDRLVLNEGYKIEYYTIIRSEDVSERWNLNSPIEKCIRIDCRGKMDAGSIFFSDKYNKEFVLAIAVETNRVRIKDD